VTKKLKAHPYAQLLPPMTAAELEALAADIAEHGLRQPVVLYDGQVLDGRHRLLACERAGVEPTFTEYDGDDPLGFVLSANITRRNLNPAQRAVVAARCVADTPLSSDGRKDTAARFGVGEKQLQQAKALLAEAADLVAQVEACSLSLAAAYEQLQERRSAAGRKAKDAATVAEFRDAISNGEMSLELAIQKAMERERQEQKNVEVEADARRNWLKGLAGVVDWVERAVAPVEAERLAWYLRPDAPGSFEHGVTAGRLTQAVADLERVGAVTLSEGARPDAKPKRGRGRPRKVTDDAAAGAAL
jgi:ParB-like chromosome segregation protein Spo0J